MKKIHYILLFWLFVIVLFILYVRSIQQEVSRVVVPHPRISAPAPKLKYKVDITSYKIKDLTNRYQLIVKFKNTGNGRVKNLKFFTKPYVYYEDDRGKQHASWETMIGTTLDHLNPGEEAECVIDVPRIYPFIPTNDFIASQATVTFDPDN